MTVFWAGVLASVGGTVVLILLALVILIRCAPVLEADDQELGV